MTPSFERTGEPAAASGGAQSTVHRRVLASTGIVMGGILLSRILGLPRDWMIAHQVGSNAATDAYNAAFTLPDFLNYLVAGGALSVTFIPVFAKYAAEDREDEAWRVFSTVVTFMSMALVALIVVGEIFAPQLVPYLISPGFSAENLERAIFLTRLMLPAQFCFYLGSILSAVQYAKGHFVIPSLASVVYNIMIILGGWLLAPSMGMTGFSVGVLCGAISGNLLLQIYGAWRVKAHYRPNLNFGHPGFRLFVRLSVPIMLALSVVFTDDWIMKNLASHLNSGAITWLSYAKNLMRVPQGAVGLGVGVASFPFLAKLYSEGKLEELNRLLNSTMKGMIALLVPISALTMAQSLPLIHFVFPNTQLKGTDFDATAGALVFFSLGMFAWGAQNILARGFYSTRNTWLPAIVGTVVTFANLPVYWLLFRRSQHLGLALASSIGIMAYTVVLFVLLNRRTHNREAGALTLFFVKVSAASAVTGWACYRLRLILEPHIAWQRFTGALLLLVIVTSAGLLLLLVLGKLLRIREMNEQIARLWRLAAGARARMASS